jgi:hypothetical protein
MTGDRIEAQKAAANAEKTEANEAATKMLADTKEPDPEKGLTQEEIEKIDKQIAKDNKPLVAMHFLVPGLHKGGIDAGPWICERVYDHGKYVASRVFAPSEPYTSEEIIIKGTRYVDMISPNGKDTLLRNNVPQGKIIPKVKEGTPEYKDVMKKLHAIDFDHIPEWNFKGPQK